MGDIDYIVDLCDEVIASEASRGHTFGWLRDEAGALAPLTAYYEQRSLAVIVLEQSGEIQREPWLRDRLATLLGRDVRPLVLVTGLFVRDGTGALLRHHEEDRSVVESALGSVLGADISDEWSFVLGTAANAEVGWTSYGPLTDGWEDWHEPEPFEEIGEEEPIDDEPEQPPEPVGGVPELGWRSRPIAQAVLGAAVLGRRAFEPRYAAGHQPLDLQVLAALLLLAEENAGREDAEDLERVAFALAAAADDVRDSVERLIARRLVERPNHIYELDDPIAITNAGADAVREWLARAALLFPGWPPEHPEADDAIGPDWPGRLQ